MGQYIYMEDKRKNNNDHILTEAFYTLSKHFEVFNLSPDWPSPNTKPCTPAALQRVQITCSKKCTSRYNTGRLLLWFTLLSHHDYVFKATEIIIRIFKRFSS